MDKIAVHVEVRVAPTSTRLDTIRRLVEELLLSSFDELTCPKVLPRSLWDEQPVLASCVEHLATSELSQSSILDSFLVFSESYVHTVSIPIDRCELDIHVYQAFEDDVFEETISADENVDSNVSAASVCTLPNKSWEGLWDNLIYSDDIKMSLLDYIYATVVLSDARVDFNIVTWNRVVLLHGPPGTGKTSLCRALSQKLAIRLSDRYNNCRLLEINSHSLFSRWFSESGKLVQRLFASVNDMIDDEGSFVVVLIDEVESLTAARAGVAAGTEPSDALRVVNALLTQLDKLRYRPNVLVLSTSNLAKAIDSAFVDRADVVRYIDLPPAKAVYEILRSCLLEFVAKGVVNHIDIPPLGQRNLWAADGSRTVVKDGMAIDGESLDSDTKTSPDPTDRSYAAARRLFSIAERCRAQKMSGRALRRLPVLAFARHAATHRSIVRPLAASADPKKKRRKANGATVNESPRKRSEEDDEKSSGQKAAADRMEAEALLAALERVVEEQGTERERFR
ncbi:AAA-domain-containing protein [Punctularia strigosozonata HHB-11173 SS5]|uniref:AAA-domain-containing protein n=1 Tax=Punctularia strigosozonata (strain HHB-11173) TaxID=741275 RepID=UPI0004417FE4|nr:AAA-domain-containing protein [Punctularia strigosozonata HHB-11173 SS5]EIN10675.1 AAA-domain-containing protein [Punctularia strigosozonata HHB-11173 SS5]